MGNIGSIGNQSLQNEAKVRERREQPQAPKNQSVAPQRAEEDAVVVNVESRVANVDSAFSLAQSLRTRIVEEESTALQAQDVDSGSIQDLLA